MMKAPRLPLDIISDLPSSIIQNILTLMPLRDAFKTSVLSRKWRYHCVNISKLLFNNKLFEGSTSYQLSNKHQVFLVIYTILLLHHASVLVFSLFFSKLQSCCEIDQIILHLARNNTLEKFALYIGSGNDHKLPSSFFSLKKLTHIKLHRCAIDPKSTFSSFSSLTSLYFSNVIISKSVLLRFLRCCPLIKKFTLIEDGSHFTESGYHNFVDLFHCLPLIENLHMNRWPVELFALGVIPQKLTNVIVHLKVLILSGLSFAKEKELRSALLLVTSSPNIEKIKIERLKLMEGASQTTMNLIDHQDYSYVRLDNLRELEISEFSGFKIEIDFVKLILAKSLMLKKVRVVIHIKFGSEDKVLILQELLELPRASSSAKIIVR